MPAPDLVNGIARRFLQPSNIARTRELLAAQLAEAMKAEDVVSTLEIGQLITAIDKQVARNAAGKK
jgi:hypothetical protein